MKESPKKIAHYTVQDMAGMAVILVCTAVIIAFGQKVLTDVGTSVRCDTGFNYNSTSGLCSNSSAQVGLTAAGNSTLKGQEGLGKFSDYLPTVAIVIVAGILIGILYNVFLKQKA